MRIGIDIRELEKGKSTGVGRYLRQFLGYASEHDNENEYILFGNQKTQYNANANNQKLKIVEENITIIWDQILLPRGIKKEKVDVLLTPYFKAPIFCNSKKVMIVNDLIDLLLEEYRHLRYFCRKMYFQLLMLFNTRSADKIITISQHTKKDLCQIFHIPDSKGEVIELSFDPVYREIHSGVKETALKYKIQKEFFLYVGNLKPHKNVLFLIEAYSQLDKTIREQYQLVIGSKKDKYFFSIYQRVQQLNLTEDVVFTDFIHEDDLPYLYNAATIFIFPSLYEGFGLPVLEAMACGTPVITSNVSSLPEVGGEATLLIDPRNGYDLKKSINRILNDENLRNDLIQKGLERAKSFSIENMSQQILNILNNI